jgi:hypothetical protein
MSLRFLLATLATWRVSHLLSAEDGPADLVIRLRERAGAGQLGALMDCFYCLSIWVAAPLALTVAARRRDLPIAWAAISGAACLLEQATTDGIDAAPGAEQDPEKGASNVLWPEAQSGEV